MEKVYKFLSSIGVEETQLPQPLQQQFEKYDALSADYNKIVEQQEALDEESQEWEELDGQADAIDAQLDELEAETLVQIKAWHTEQKNTPPAGQQTPPAGQQTPPAGQQTPPAGQQTASGWRARQQQQAAPAGKPKKKDNTLLWVLGGLVAVVTLGAVTLKND